VQEARVIQGAEAERLVQQALSAQRRAKYAQALELLEHCADWPAPYNEQGLLLRAKVLTVQDAVAGLEALASNAHAFTTPDGRFGYLIESARAYTKARNFDVAAAMLDSAEKMMDGSADPRRSKIALHRLRLMWTTANYDPESELFAVALRDPDPAERLSTLVVRGGMHGGLENYRAQLQDLKAALNLYLEHHDQCDLAGVAAGLQTAIYVGFDMAEAEPVRLGERVFNEIEWTPELDVYRFLCLRGLAWAAFLDGESARAQWLFKDSKEAAPTEAWKVMAHVDRAFVARMNGNEAWAIEELHLAHALARNIDWQTTRNEERTALTTLAAMLAPVDMAQAQRYVNTYIQLGKDSLDPTLASAQEPRRNTAVQRYASGCVQSVLGNRDVAIHLLESAYATFNDIEYSYRAALAAQALYDATGNRAWQELARAHAAKYPKSALNTRMDAETQKEGEAASLLTPSQKQIALAFCAGSELTELSRRFSRSTFTLQKQLERIYEAFGVNSRAGLRDALHGQGLL
jgi:DNA-binding CsgD family transcriptional regulator